MTDEHAGASRRRSVARALSALAVLVLAAAACERGAPGGGTPDPQPTEAAGDRQAAERECRTFGRILGLDGLAEELDASSPDPREVAVAYADRTAGGDAAEEGCLAGAREVVALEAEVARLEPLAREAARRAGCTGIRTTPDEGQRHIQPGDSPPEYRTTPAASGPHEPGPLPSEVSVYHEPVDEPAAVHNLEHAYVLLYYRTGGPEVAPEVVAAFESLAREFDKVIVAPYPGLPRDAGAAMVAWRRLQLCPPTIGAPEAETMARSFVVRFAGTAVAPEPLGA